MSQEPVTKEMLKPPGNPDALLYLTSLFIAELITNGAATVYFAKGVAQLAAPSEIRFTDDVLARLSSEEIVERLILEGFDDDYVETKVKEIKGATP